MPAAVILLLLRSASVTAACLARLVRVLGHEEQQLHDAVLEQARQQVLVQP